MPSFPRLLPELRIHHEDRIQTRKEKLLRELKFAENMIEAGMEQQVARHDRETYRKIKREKEASETSLSKVEGLLAAIGTPQCSLGPIRSFSDFRKDDKTRMILNWALFPIESSKAPIENKLPSQPKSVRVMDYCLRGYLAPLANKTVHKIRRTTGFTTGIINPADSYIHTFESKSTEVWPAKPDTEHQQRPELSAAFAASLVPKGNDMKFAGPGDFGAIVFSADGMIKGLFVAGSSNYRVSYMTPSIELVKDIKKMIGAEDVCFLGAD